MEDHGIHSDCFIFTCPLFSPQLRDMEVELEDERKQRNSLAAARKKLEADVKDLEDQVDALSRSRDEAVKQLRKTQVSFNIPFKLIDISKAHGLNLLSSQAQVKDYQRDLEDTRSAHKEALSNTRETERRAKNMEADIAHLQEVKRL